MTDTNNDVEKSGPVTSRKNEMDMTEQTKSLTQKLTAADIEKDHNLPPRLAAIGKEIEAKLSKADRYHTKASDMVDSIKELLAEAGEYCDKGGFDAFRKHCCPSLGRSRAYDLLAIASGKKSIEEVKAGNAARQAKHIGKLKATAAAIPLVTDDADTPLAPVLGNSGKSPPTGSSNIEATCSEAPDLVKRHRAVNPKDPNVFEFTAILSRLLQMIDKQRPDRFKATAIPPDKLAKLGKYLTKLADLKNGGIPKPIPAMRVQGNGAVSPDQSAKAMKAAHEANEGKEVAPEGDLPRAP